MAYSTGFEVAEAVRKALPDVLGARREYGRAAAALAKDSSSMQQILLAGFEEAGVDVVPVIGEAAETLGRGCGDVVLAMLFAGVGGGQAAFLAVPPYRAGAVPALMAFEADVESVRTGPCGSVTDLDVVALRPQVQASFGLDQASRWLVGLAALAADCSRR